MELEEQFSETAANVARAVDDSCDPATVRLYADLRLIPCLRLRNGTRLFKPSAAALVREIRAERLSRRGGNHKRAASHA
jgi:DNA-binding transcriptional MerR regulator